MIIITRPAAATLAPPPPGAQHWRTWMCPGMPQAAARGLPGPIAWFSNFCENWGKTEKCAFFQVFLRTLWLQPAQNLVQRWHICNASALSMNSIHSNTNRKKVSKTVVEWSKRIAFGSRDSELAAKIQARLTLPDGSRLIKVFWLRHHCGLQNQKGYKAWTVLCFWLDFCSSCLELDILVFLFWFLVDVLVSLCHSGSLWGSVW